MALVYITFIPIYPLYLMPDAVLLQHIFYPRAQHCCIVVVTGTNIQQNQFEYIENSGNLNLPIHNHCHCHYRQKRKKMLLRLANNCFQIIFHILNHLCCCFHMHLWSILSIMLILRHRMYKFVGHKLELVIEEKNGLKVLLWSN